MSVKRVDGMAVRGVTDAVEVILGAARHVEVHDVRDAVHADAA
jgi:hypothetical protein